MSFCDSVIRDAVFERVVKPAEILLKRLGKVIIVEFDGGNNLRGKLVRFDGHMNLLLEDACEITTWGEVNSLGCVLLRGGNVVLILANIAEMVF